LSAFNGTVNSGTADGKRLGLAVLSGGVQFKEVVFLLGEELRLLPS